MTEAGRRRFDRGMIVGLVAADGGKIELDGENLSRLPIHQRARRGLSYLPQGASIFRKLTVENNLLGMMEMLGFDRRTRRARCDELLEQFDITRLRKSRVSLSKYVRQLGSTLAGFSA